MSKKAYKPIILKTKLPTSVNNLGHLNAAFCPTCKRHLFSFYDKEINGLYEDGYKFKIAACWNYCSKCGTLLDLDFFKDPNDPDIDKDYESFIKNQM